MPISVTSPRRVLLLAQPPNPADEQELQWKPRDERPFREAGKFRAIERHVDVRRKDGDEQRDQTVGGVTARLRDQQSDATGEFRRAADRDEGLLRGQHRRDDLHECVGLEKMHRPAARKDQRSEAQRKAVHPRRVVGREA